QADQNGTSKYRFTLVPSGRRALGTSAQAALAYAQPLAAHVYAGRGPVKSTAASLLRLDLGTALLTRLEAAGDGVALHLLNPGDEPVEARVGAGSFRPTRANRTSLSGEPGEALSVNNGSTSFTIAPRAWTRIELH